MYIGPKQMSQEASNVATAHVSSSEAECHWGKKLKNAEVRADVDSYSDVDQTLLLVI